MLIVSPTAKVSALADIEDSTRGTRIVIEDDVWVGANSVLLDGAILRRGCVVGAGSVVRDELPEYSINVGSPARTVSWRK